MDTAAGGSRPRRGPRPNSGGIASLTGAGQSQVGVDGALRARDVNRPSTAELAEAEATTEIVRTNWKPRDNP